MPEPVRPSQNTAAPVRLVVFDWGGVILRICRSLAEGCAAAGLDLRLDPDHPGTGDLYRANQALSREHQTGAIGAPVFFERLSRSFSGAYSVAELERIHDAWLLGEYPGVGALIAELHARAAVETGLLSNTDDRHWRRREREFPAAGSLHHQHASHLLGVAKPDPTIYAAFERRTGRTGDGILFFDDLEENVTAARAAGWRAELIDHTGDTAIQMRRHLHAHGVWI